MSSKKYPTKRRRSRITDTNHVTDLREIGEFGLIERIKKWVTLDDPSLVQGIGDDAAVIEWGDKVLLVTTDILIEDIHFDRSWIDPYYLGKKSLAVNLSDIAAMGGSPRYFLISLGLTKNLPFTFLSRFYRGLKEEAKRYGAELIGGDTSLSHKIIVNICLIGEGKKGNLLFRKGARVGDDLFVSGTLGDSALGLEILKKKRRLKGSNVLVKKHLSPCPRIQLGQTISRHQWAHAMIDVSDGVIIDTTHLLKESGVGARIWEEKIPLSASYRKWIHSFSKDYYSMALTGGEDYELLFTAPPEARKKLTSLGLSVQIPITCIGKILPKKEGFRIVKKDGKEYFPSQGGFDHFK